MAHEQTDLVPIGTVIATLLPLYPDLSHSSLRFLEREGLIEPQRSSGGHRLYSPADIQRIHQIKEWQARRLSLAEIRVRLSQQARADRGTDLAATVLDFFLTGRIREAQEALLNADEAGSFSLAAMFRDVISPVMVEIGERWERGLLPVSQEKEISEACRDVIADLSLRHRAHHLTGPVVIAATVWGELHELGLRMICGVLGANGFAVRYLRANIAPSHIAEAVQRHHPAAVLLSVHSPSNLPAIRDTVEAIRDVVDDGSTPAILVGGATIPGHEATVAGWGATPLTVRDYEQIPSVIAPMIAMATRDTGS